MYNLSYILYLGEYRLIHVNVNNFEKFRKLLFVCNVLQ